MRRYVIFSIISSPPSSSHLSNTVRSFLSCQFCLHWCLYCSNILCVIAKTFKKRHNLSIHCYPQNRPRHRCHWCFIWAEASRNIPTTNWLTTDFSWKNHLKKIDGYPCPFTNSVAKSLKVHLNLFTYGKNGVELSPSPLSAAFRRVIQLCCCHLFIELF